MSEESDKTFDPTPKRREEFRKQGKFARARDAGTIATVGAALMALFVTREATGRALDDLFERCFGHLGDEIPWSVVGGALVALTLPVALATALAGAAAGLAQTRLQVFPSLVGFKFDRIDPFGRLKQMLSPREGLLETGISLLRIGVTGVVAYRVARAEVDALLRTVGMPLEASGSLLTQSVTRVTVGALLALVVLTVVDYGQSWFKLEREMRMTRKEVMDEQKSEQGDPRRRARQRAKARAIARKRSIQNVKHAAVVVTNPTHVSVALRYEATDPAPVVVAKGQDDLALRIRAEARKHGVPILENRKLARALDAEVPLGHPVPAAHFVAVARVLAFVMRLRGTKAARRRV